MDIGSGQLLEVFVARGHAYMSRARYSESRNDIPAARAAFDSARRDYREAIRLDPGAEASLKSGGLGEAERKLTELKSP